MSHIVSFKICGLAGREEPLELELNRDTNIFFGLNGSGKTSLLKILHAAMANETEILNSVPFASAEVKIFSRDWDRVFTRTLEKDRDSYGSKSKPRHIVHREIGGERIYFSSAPSREELKWVCLPTKPKQASITRWAHKYLPTSRLHVSEDLQVRHYERPDLSGPWLTEERLDYFFARSIENLWSRYSAQVLSSVRTAQEHTLVNILRAVLSPETARERRKRNKLTAETAFERVQSFLERQGSSASILGQKVDFEHRYAQDRTLQDVVQDIDLVEEKIKKLMSSRDVLEQLITRMFTANKTIQFSDEAIEVLAFSGEKIGLASLSSGEKHLLRILVDLLLVGESSMMIDEPEISMHIDWQKDLIKSMRALNPNSQLILATHSPEIMADVEDDKIFRI